MNEVLTATMEQHKPLGQEWAEAIVTARERLGSLDLNQSFKAWVDKLPQLPSEVETIFRPKKPVDRIALTTELEKRGMSGSEAKEEAVLYSLANGDAVIPLSEVMAILKQRVASLVNFGVISQENGEQVTNLILAADQRRRAGRGLRTLGQRGGAGGASPKKPPSEKEKEEQEEGRSWAVSIAVFLLVIGSVCVPASCTVGILTRGGEAGSLKLKQLSTDEDLRAVANLEAGKSNQERRIIEGFYSSGKSQAEVITREYAPGVLLEMNQRFNSEDGFDDHEIALARGWTKTWRRDFFENSQFDEGKFLQTFQNLNYLKNKNDEQQIRLLLSKYKQFRVEEKIDKIQSKNDQEDQITTAQGLLDVTGMAGTVDAPTLIAMAESFPPGTTTVELKQATPKVFPNLPPAPPGVGLDSWVLAGACLASMMNKSPELVHWAKTQLRGIKPH